MSSGTPGLPRMPRIERLGDDAFALQKNPYEITLHYSAIARTICSLNIHWYLNVLISISI